MILFHGSATGGIKVLKPHLADHDRPYVYMTTIDVVAAFYLCNGVERPYYWFPYGFRNGDPDIPVYDELYPDALKEVSQGVHGYIYQADVRDDQVIPFKNIPCARLATEPIEVVSCTEVHDAYELFQRYEEQGRMKLCRFEEQSKKKLEWYYREILDYIRSKQMCKTPDCSYAVFVKNKFPFIWEAYLRDF